MVLPRLQGKQPHEPQEPDPVPAPQDFRWFGLLPPTSRCCQHSHRGLLVWPLERLGAAGQLARAGGDASARPPDIQDTQIREPTSHPEVLKCGGLPHLVRLVMD
eukprot:2830504-Alexandrium_andersonii.AAC.1